MQSPSDSARLLSIRGVILCSLLPTRRLCRPAPASLPRLSGPGSLGTAATCRACVKRTLLTKATAVLPAQESPGTWHQRSRLADPLFTLQNLPSALPFYEACSVCPLSICFSAVQLVVVHPLSPEQMILSIQTPSTRFRRPSLLAAVDCLRRAHSATVVVLGV